MILSKQMIRKGDKTTAFYHVYIYTVTLQLIPPLTKQLIIEIEHNIYLISLTNLNPADKLRNNHLLPLGRSKPKLLRQPENRS